MVRVSRNVSGRAMIAVTCSACRLRFEAPAVERRIHGADIVCPACDAGEPVMLDFTERAANGRLRVSPPPLDPTGSATLERSLSFDLEGPALDEIRGASPQSVPPFPVYVDFDRTEESAPRSTWMSFVGSAAAVLMLFFLATTLTWQFDTSPFDGAKGLMAGWLAPSAVEGAADGAVEDITTASIAAIEPAPRLAIARVVTELADTDEGRVLSVRSDIRNDGNTPAEAPALRVAIRSLDGTILHRWTTTPDRAWIDPGETRAFVATTRRIPDGAGDVKVDFATR